MPASKLKPFIVMTFNATFIVSSPSVDCRRSFFFFIVVVAWFCCRPVTAATGTLKLNLTFNKIQVERQFSNLTARMTVAVRNIDGDIVLVCIQTL